MSRSPEWLEASVVARLAARLSWLIVPGTGVPAPKAMGSMGFADNMVVGEVCGGKSKLNSLTSIRKQAPTL